MTTAWIIVRCLKHAPELDFDDWARRSFLLRIGLVAPHPKREALCRAPTFATCGQRANLRAGSRRTTCPALAAQLGTGSLSPPQPRRSKCDLRVLGMARP